MSLKEESNAKNNRESKKCSNIFFVILGILYLILSILFAIYTINLNMLPNKYLIIGIVGDVLITGIITFVILKRHKKIILNIIFTILALAILVGYGYAYNYLKATMDFIDTVSQVVEETEDYHVVVLNSSEFSSINDLDGKNIHVFSTGEDYTDIKNDIKSKVEVLFKVDESLDELTTDFLSGKNPFILVSESQYEMIKENIEGFSEKSKIIYTVKHKITGPTGQELLDEKSDIKISNEKFNVYISGIDTSGSISNVSRSDANIVVSVNTKTNKVLLTSIPRDYYVTLHSKGVKDKLTHSGIYGINETVKTVEDLLDTKINYYIRVNFTTVIKLVDVLDGVDVDSDFDFKAGGYTFVKGINHVNGKQALAFARERYSFIDGDNQRIRDQQKVIEAILKKVLNNTTILTKYTSILSSLSGNIQTNINQEDINSLVKKQLEDMKPWNISKNSLSGSGASSSTYSMGNQLLYVMIPNKASVEVAKTKINSVLNEE